MEKIDPTQRPDILDALTQMEQLQYEVTVKVYVWAFDPQDAVDMVEGDLKYLIGTGGADIVGYQHPILNDAVVDVEP